MCIKPAADMDFKDLECFLALSEELSFTRAAARMHMAQPPFSYRIKQLEEALGVRLFDRNNKSVRQTDAGKTFEPLTRQILNMTRYAIETTRQVEQGIAGRVLLGAIYSSVYRAVPNFIKTAAMRYPAVELLVEEMGVEAQLAALRMGSIDGGILRLSRHEPDIESVLLFRENCLAAVNSEHPFAQRKKLSLADIAQQTVVAFEPSFSPEYDALIAAAFAAKRLTPAHVRRVRSMHMMLSLVGAGIGMAIVPASLAGIHLERVTYIPLAERLPIQEVRLAWLATSAPPIVLKLAEMAGDIDWT